MSKKTSIEEAAERLEAIARTRRVQEAIGEIAERFEVETTLKKASGLEAVELTAAEGDVPPPQRRGRRSRTHRYVAEARLSRLAHITSVIEEGLLSF